MCQTEGNFVVNRVATPQAFTRESISSEFGVVLTYHGMSFAGTGLCGSQPGIGVGLSIGSVGIIVCLFIAKVTLVVVVSVIVALVYESNHSCNDIFKQLTIGRCIMLSVGNLRLATVTLFVSFLARLGLIGIASFTIDSEAVRISGNRSNSCSLCWVLDKGLPSVREPRELVI